MELQISLPDQRTRTCNQIVMSDGKSSSFADFAVFSFEFDRVRCALVGAFLVRSWCGFASSAQKSVGYSRMAARGVREVQEASSATAQIDVQVFKPKGELIGVETLGTTPKLCALKLFDDRLKTLDLAVPMRDDRGNVAHQAMQKRSVRRQIFEVELHGRFYSGTLIRRSGFPIFYAVFCTF